MPGEQVIVFFDFPRGDRVEMHMEAVPRKDEFVVIEGTTYLVSSVVWIFREPDIPHVIVRLWRAA